MKIADLTVSSTSGKGGAKDRVTVRKGDVEIARVELRHRSPLHYVRKWPNGKHGTSFRLQLTAAGIDGKSIAMILDEPLPHRRRAGDIERTTFSTQVWFSILTPDVSKDSTIGK